MKKQYNLDLFKYRLIIALGVLGVGLLSWSTASADANSDFLARATHPDVVFYEAFDAESVVLEKRLPDSRKEFVTWSTGTKASGTGALQFEIPSNSPANSSGNWRTNFADDNYSIKFGSGDHLYIQWRQRFSQSMLDTIYDANSGTTGWKQFIVGEGDYAGWNYGDAQESSSCTTLELVVVNTQQRYFPQMYHSCGDYWPLQETQAPYYYKLQNAIDAGSEVTPIENRFVLYPFEPSEVTGLRSGSPAMSYYPDEWMTFQVHIAPGPLGCARDPLIGATRCGFTNSTVEMWVAREGQPSVKTHEFHGLVLQRGDGATDSDEKYGKIWFTPFMTDKDYSQVHPVGYTWYDELIVSRSRIADPGAVTSPSVTFGAEPVLVESNGYTMLTWSTTNADSCVASGDWSGSKSVLGSENIGPLTTAARFELTCTGTGGSSTRTILVSVADSGTGDTNPDNGDSGSGTGDDSANSITNITTSGGAGSLGPLWLLILLLPLGYRSIFYQR